MAKKLKTLVISDIHGNADALRAVINEEKNVDQSIFLGDALLSGPQAQETAELLHELDPDICIMGNHDEELLDPSIYAEWPAEWVAFNNAIIDSLTPDAIQPFNDYLPSGQYKLGSLEMYLHHGKTDSGSHAALPNATDDVLGTLDNHSGSPIVMFGHTHIQFTREVGKTTYINPGSVGQPRCGKLHACYGVFEGEQYFPRQVTYDPSGWLAALERMEALDPFPDFKKWIRDGLLNGFGIGENEPWTQFAAEGYD